MDKILLVYRNGQGYRVEWVGGKKGEKMAKDTESSRNCYMCHKEAKVVFLDKDKDPWCINCAKLAMSLLKEATKRSLEFTKWGGG